MKISTHLMFDKATKQMTTSQTNLAKSQAQLAQGKQIINPSDSPDQASTVQRLKSILSRQDSYQTALNTVQNRLQGEDSTLSSVSDLLIRTKEIAVQANNDTLSPANRKALGVELQGLRDQMPTAKMPAATTCLPAAVPPCPRLYPMQGAALSM
jgi:flagellar hook-associated protein 3 FlgL